MRETIDGHVIEFDRTVTLPYNKIQEDGEITFYMVYHDHVPGSEFGPPEGGYEVVYWVGEILDDDIPDLSSDAMAKAEDLDINDHPW